MKTQTILGTGTRSKFFAKIFIAVSFFILSVGSAYADTLPTVKFTSPTSGSTVFGLIDVAAVAAADSAGSATITQWCFTLDGTKIKDLDMPPFGPINDLAGANFNQATGCLINESKSIEKGWLTFDSSNWPHGNHTITVQVTDSNNRVSKAASLIIKRNRESALLGNIGYTEFESSGQIFFNLMQPSSRGIKATSFEMNIDGRIVCTKNLKTTSNGGVCRFGLADVENGAHVAEVTLLLSDGRSISKSVNFKSKLSKSKSGLKWASQMSDSVYRTGSMVPISGTVVGVNRPTKLTLRSKIGSGAWSAWKVLNTDKSGKFFTIVKAAENISIQVKVPKVGSSPVTVFTKSVGVSPNLSMIAPRNVSPHNPADFVISMNREINGEVQYSYSMSFFDGTFQDSDSGTLAITNGAGRLTITPYLSGTVSVCIMSTVADFYPAWACSTVTVN